MNTNYSRAHVQFTTMKDIKNFVELLNADGTADRYTIENANGSLRINARSLEGVIYAAIDYNDETYLVNETNDGVYPHGIDDFRTLKFDKF